MDFKMPNETDAAYAARTQNKNAKKLQRESINFQANWNKEFLKIFSAIEKQEKATAECLEQLRKDNKRLKWSTIFAILISLITASASLLTAIMALRQ